MGNAGYSHKNSGKTLDDQFVEESNHQFCHYRNNYNNYFPQISSAQSSSKRSYFHEVVKRKRMKEINESNANWNSPQDKKIGSLLIDGSLPDNLESWNSGISTV